MEVMRDGREATRTGARSHGGCFARGRGERRSERTNDPQACQPAARERRHRARPLGERWLRRTAARQRRRHIPQRQALPREQRDPAGGIRRDTCDRTRGCVMAAGTIREWGGRYLALLGSDWSKRRAEDITQYIRRRLHRHARQQLPEGLLLPRPRRYRQVHRGELQSAFLGPENVASVGLHQLDDRFATADLYGVLANIFADLDARALRASGIFKSITGGDQIRAERKYARVLPSRPM